MSQVKYVSVSIIAMVLFTVLISAAENPTVVPPSKPLIAVHTLEGRGIDENEAATLTDVLRDKLVKTESYEVMERGQMETILQEQAFQQSGACTDQECIVEMGQILGIEQIVAGSIGKVGSAYSINIRIISVRTGKITRSVSHSYTGPIENLLTTEMGVVANKLEGKETVYKERASEMRRKKDPKKRRRNFIIGGAALLATGGSVAAFLILRGDEEDEEPTTLEVTWQQQ